MFALAACAALALAPVPAAACSIIFTAPRDPAVRYAGTDVRRVTGTYRIGRMVIPDDASSPALIYGRLTTRRGTWFDVAQPYRQQWVDCLVYDLPMGDAEGLFYLSRRSRAARYELLGWRGGYVPGGRSLESAAEGRN